MPDLGFKFEGAESAKFAASPQINFKLRLNNSDPYGSNSFRRLAVSDSTRGYATPLYRGGATKAARSVRRTRALEPDSAQSALDSRECECPSLSAGKLLSISRCHARSISTWARRNIFMGWATDKCPSASCSAELFSMRAMASPLQVAPISWDKEARFNLPVKVWHDMMDSYYPNTAWIHLRRDVFERLYDYKVRHGIPTWEQAFGTNAAGGRTGALMNLARVDQIAKAVLYEGLHAVSLSAIVGEKSSALEFRSGVSASPTASVRMARKFGACTLSVLVSGDANTRIETRLRFLHLQIRSTLASAQSGSGSMEGWQEAVERDVALPRMHSSASYAGSLSATRSHFPRLGWLTNSERRCDI